MYLRINLPVTFQAIPNFSKPKCKKSKAFTVSPLFKAMNCLVKPNCIGTNIIHTAIEAKKPIKGIALNKPPTNPIPTQTIRYAKNASNVFPYLENKVLNPELIIFPLFKQFEIVFLFF